ncbi:hypothetical protein PMIN01_11411 [Paraphaeosphaeria minitans]|uniref:Uncharacterized protein n=1 Tax=Paraphaeosphaeria minitans TaxID=565426 RepID=A0A9P6G7X8_9PLEO|nr:hypothetical protein PMIN01_11411 [Paraphaeosphaeria minitans]
MPTCDVQTAFAHARARPTTNVPQGKKERIPRGHDQRSVTRTHAVFPTQPPPTSRRHVPNARPDGSMHPVPHEEVSRVRPPTLRLVSVAASGTRTHGRQPLGSDRLPFVRDACRDDPGCDGAAAGVGIFGACTGGVWGGCVTA